MNSKTVELRLRVRYERTDGARPTDEECQAPLNSLVQYAADNGLISGDGELIVDDYRHEIALVGLD
jgi:hypothetical protein